MNAKEIAFKHQKSTQYHKKDGVRGSRKPVCLSNI